jgi:hypothetical protein
MTLAEVEPHRKGVAGSLEEMKLGCEVVLSPEFFGVYSFLWFANPNATDISHYLCYVTLQCNPNATILLTAPRAPFCCEYGDSK